MSASKEPRRGLSLSNGERSGEGEAEMPRTRVPSRASQAHFDADALADPETERPFALATLSRVMVRPDLSIDPHRSRRFLIRLAILIGMSALAAMVLGPRLVDRELPTHDGAIGTRAHSHVTADRDYAIVDETATQMARESAKQASRSVWDLHLPQAKRDARALAQELTFLSTQLQALRASVVPANSAVEVEVVEVESAELEGKTKKVLLPGDLRESDDDKSPRFTSDGQRIEKRTAEEKDLDVPLVVVELGELDATGLQKARAAFAGNLALLGVEAPRDTSWQALARGLLRDPFLASSLPAEVERALSSPIVGDRALLLRDEEVGIVLRSLQTGDLHSQSRKITDYAEERVLIDLTTLLDKKGANQSLHNRLKEVLHFLPQHDVTAIGDFLSQLLRTSLTYNAAETELRRLQAEAPVPQQMVRVRLGETIVFRGEVIMPRHLLLFRAMEAQQGDAVRVRAALGTGAFILLLCAVIYLFGVRGIFQRQVQNRDLVFSSTLLLLLLMLIFAAEAATPFLLARFPALPRPVVLYAIPVAWAGMQARFVLTSDAALMLILVIAVLGGVMTEPGMQWTVVALLSSLAGTAGVLRISSRASLFLSGATAGLVGAGAAVTLELFRGTLVGEPLFWLAGASLVGGIISGVLVIITTPLFEAAFGFVTDLRLLSLADLNQPLLKELILNAPGTWHHSMRVGQLTERAAKAIGANPLLARVMSLYHDVGKIRRPEFFRENQTRDNPHERLRPKESVAILRDHVTVGVELAARYRIPLEVASVIEEHHADNRMDYFYSRAKAKIEVGDDQVPHDDVDETHFCYRGRPPQTPESALVMLADQMEAASRSIQEPRSRQLREIVDHFVNRAIVEATLSACGISLREIEVVRLAFHEGLCALVGIDVHILQEPALTSTTDSVASLRTEESGESSPLDGPKKREQ
ncbi:MAG: HDIG domain-containing protein [Deltaproteobacteria bacterium]|nr:HDIG domain-containing protein [Deltaproteobacteria bacterium]